MLQIVVEDKRVTPLILTTSDAVAMKNQFSKMIAVRQVVVEDSCG